MNRLAIAASAAFLVTLGSGIAAAQPAPAPAVNMGGPDPSTVTIKTTELGHGAYMMEGAGTNTTVVVGQDGVIIVDTMFASLADKLKAAVAAITKLPVKYVIDTHHHSDANGAAPAFAKSGAVIVAYEGTRKRLSEMGSGPGGVLVPPLPPAGLPKVTFKDTKTLQIKGVSAVLWHTPPTHSDNDTIVYFPEPNILATSVVFAAEGYPALDIANGGTINNLIRTIDTMMAKINEQTVINPGHGPAQKKSDLVAYRAMLVDAKDRIGKLKAQNMTGDQVIATHPLANIAARWNSNAMATDRFVRLVYEDFSSVEIAKLRAAKLAAK